MNRRLVPIAVLLAAFIGLTAAVIAVGPKSVDDNNPSSISAGHQGTLALYTWLGKLGYNAGRLETSFDLPSGGTLISVEPAEHYSDEDVVALTSFVDGGGTAIVAASDTISINNILEKFGIRATGDVLTPFTDAAQPINFYGAARVQMLPQPMVLALYNQSVNVFSPSAADVVPVLGTDSIVGVGVAHGTGKLFVLGNSYPLSNDGLRRADNAAFVLSLVARGGQNDVIFDDYHHGGAGGANLGLDSVFKGPLLLAVWITIFILLLYFFTSGRRLGRVMAPQSRDRLPTANEYIESMAHLYSRSAQRGHIAERYAAELKQRLAAVTGAHAYVPDEQFLAEIRPFDAAGAEVAAGILRRARSLAAGAPSEEALLNLARDVDACERAWNAAPV